jgi:LmbE family N-acetylglucosaminyl deacetylase
MKKIAMAIGAHPDDIEFRMAGTFILLGKLGWELHYMNIANGCCGSVTMSAEETVRTRAQEARNAAALIGATFYPSVTADIEVYHERPIIRKVCAAIRQAEPTILLVPSPQDYMEDHTNASRVAVTAAICRNIPNYESDPPVKSIDNEMCIYHAQPHEHIDQLRNFITPDFVVDVTSVIDTQRQMLCCHESQKSWLDATQGSDNYINWMESGLRRMGELAASTGSAPFEFGEGWRQHSWMAYGPKDFDPLRDALRDYIVETRK